MNPPLLPKPWLLGALCALTLACATLGTPTLGLNLPHLGNFLREHPREARASGVTCAQCHEQTFCSECHAKTVGFRVETALPERVDRSFIHANDYVGRHSIEARADGATCQRCHGMKFCQSCHLAQQAPAQDGRRASPHPAGFGGRGTRSHAHDARRDIVRCASCHDQGPGSNCVECHRVGGEGGNPHPSSWLTRHGLDELNRNAMCRVCHP